MSFAVFLTSIIIRISGQNPGDSCYDIELQNIFHVFFFSLFFSHFSFHFFFPPTDVTYNICDSGDRVTEETWDVPTWIRVPLTMYTCILSEGVGVFELVYGESRRVVVRASRDTQSPTIVAKSPAKSLLLIIRQREHHG